MNILQACTTMLEQQIILPGNFTTFSKREMVEEIIFLCEKYPSIASKHVTSLLVECDKTLKNVLDSVKGLKMKNISKDGNVNFCIDDKSNSTSLHVKRSLLTIDEDILKKISFDISNDVFSISNYKND